MDNRTLGEIIIDMMKNGDFELKPCPFCGGKPRLMDKQFFDELQDESNDNRACITITCDNCNLELYDHTHYEHDYYMRSFLVVEKWNRRAE